MGVGTCGKPIAICHRVEPRNRYDRLLRTREVSIVPVWGGILPVVSRNRSYSSTVTWVAAMANESTQTR
jgi:hypothetical protein